MMCRDELGLELGLIIPNRFEGGTLSLIIQSKIFPKGSVIMTSQKRVKSCILPGQVKVHEKWDEGGLKIYNFV